MAQSIRIKMEDIMEKIEKVFFRYGRIGVETDCGNIMELPLEVFPALFYATPDQRENYRIWDNGRSIRWDDVDEDIHISHFQEPEHVNYNNPVNQLLSGFPTLDLKAFADYIGIHWTFLARMRFGVVETSPEMLLRIKGGIRSLGKELMHIA